MRTVIKQPHDLAAVQLGAFYFFFYLCFPNYLSYKSLPIPPLRQLLQPCQSLHSQYQCPKLQMFKSSKFYFPLFYSKSFSFFQIYFHMATKVSFLRVQITSLLFIKNVNMAHLTQFFNNLVLSLFQLRLTISHQALISFISCLTKIPHFNSLVALLCLVTLYMHIFCLVNTNLTISILFFGIQVKYHLFCQAFREFPRQLFLCVFTELSIDFSCSNCI